MLKKTITYTDYDGTVRTEDHWFHLTKADVIKWLTTSGDYTLDKLLLKLSNERNGKEIIRIFEDLITSAYGEKSLDGRGFIKDPARTKAFQQTEAYSQLFCDIVLDGKKAAEFINGIIPKELADEVSKAIKDNPEGIPAELKDYVS